jgi:hypothetical protein
MACSIRPRQIDHSAGKSLPKLPAWPRPSTRQAARERQKSPKGRRLKGVSSRPTPVLHSISSKRPVLTEADGRARQVGERHPALPPGQRSHAILLCCIARRTASVVRALPRRIWPITSPAMMLASRTRRCRIKHSVMKHCVLEIFPCIVVRSSV